jgi:PPOX class probable F420-dependent enzyme
MMSRMLDASERAFVAERRTATLATVSRVGRPRLMPICFVLADLDPAEAQPVIWSPLDEKPKQVGDPRRLARVRDIEERPEVSLLFERWSEDWSRLAWLRARGIATLIEPADDAAAHRWAVGALRAKYGQYRGQHLEARPMLRIALVHTVSWGTLSGPRDDPRHAPG